MVSDGERFAEESDVSATSTSRGEGHDVRSPNRPNRWPDRFGRGAFPVARPCWHYESMMVQPGYYAADQLDQQGETMNEEGWYIDPYRRHEARWISAGTPTSLVRDGSVEAQDTPPNEPMPAEIEPWAPYGVADASNLKRADDVEAQDFDPKRLRQAAFDAIDQTPTGY